MHGKKCKSIYIHKKKNEQQISYIDWVYWMLVQVRTEFVLKSSLKIIVVIALVKFSLFLFTATINQTTIAMHVNEFICVIRCEFGF